MCLATDQRPALGAFASFAEAAEAVLHMLASIAPMQAWMVTRVDGEDWIPLVLSDRGYGLARGEALPWHDSFCVRMVRGEGPAVAGACAEVGAYRDAPIGQRLPIGAYAPRWFMGAVHLEPREALLALRDLGASAMVASHWGTFDLADEAVDEPPRVLAAALAGEGFADLAPRVRVPAIGETMPVGR